MSAIEKKKRNDQPIYVKKKALKELNNGGSVKDLARHLDVHPNTIRRWKKAESSIIKVKDEQKKSLPKKLKRVRKLANEQVDQAVWDWFQERRKRGVLLDGKQIKIQAKAIHESLNGNPDTFQASNGWLDKFKRRHNIRALTTGGKKFSDHESMISEETFKDSLKNVITYCRQNNYGIFAKDINYFEEVEEAIDE